MTIRKGNSSPRDAGILTTHGGSLPRSPEVLDAVVTGGKDRESAESAIRREVADIVKRQAEIGISVVSDGELSKPGFVNYISDRLTGFGGSSPFPPMGDLAEFPEYAAELHGRRGARMSLPCCQGPVESRGVEGVQRDIDNLKAALEGVEVADAFIPAAAPGVIVQDFNNEYYASKSEYLAAVADAMREEYRAIVDAGFLVQVDAPDLAMSRHVRFRDASVDAFREGIHSHVDALNHALEGIPSERVRLHVCWGNYPGPHHLDVPLRDIIDLALEVNADGLYIEAANPRHEHEWRVFEDVQLPEDKHLIVGVVDTKSTYIEHPELVAERLMRYAQLVGPDRVMAATDCGFGTFAGVGAVHPTVAWAKLGALVEGADIASRALAGVPA
jgi:5-methyltetrahydropteroyltriglutamate--homocysteine methyltransferase